MGVYIFQDDVSYESICLGGVFVFRMAYLAICSVLLKKNKKHFLLDDMFYLRVYIIGGHVLQFMLYMFCRRTYFTT